MHEGKPPKMFVFGVACVNHTCGIEQKFRPTMQRHFTESVIVFDPGGVLRFRMGTDVRPGIPTTTL